MAAFKEGSNHMGLPDLVLVRDRLREIGAAGEATAFILNHFSHNGGLNHRELCDAAGIQGFTIAWDGFTALS
jgi:phosphoribosyl 1,2-cyclic phosphate phosphodiesterase